jgi:peptidoglycan/LPS O-acetylase OafA/YrhL
MRRIPSLDGLRALSIGMVLIGHSGLLHRSHFPILYSIGNGDLGVSIFFVISGFLITGLLLREETKTGKISLRHFYLRRACRILPPFYLFVLVIIVLWKVGALSLSWRGVGSATAFISDYVWRHDWFLGHTWSLSIEEQFYLLWPATLVVLGRRLASYLAACIILLSPIIRVSTYYLLPSLRFDMGHMLHNRADALMWGCLLALLYDSSVFNRVAGRVLQPKWLVMAGLFLFTATPWLTERFRGAYSLPFGYSLEAFCISMLLLHVVRNHTDRCGRFLNSSLMVHIGLISYSLYLWQQLFISEVWGKFIPLNLALAFLAAELSWIIVERPALRLRSKVMERVELAAAA